MANEWINAIKAVQKKEGISYKEAMVKAASTYKRKNKKTNSKTFSLNSG